MNPSLDSLHRSSDVSTRRFRLPAWSIPLLIVSGFALLFFALFRDRILPAQEVEVAMVLATPSESAASASGTPVQEPPTDGPMAFQASGWIEPDPLPMKATALVDGVIDTVHVLEGQSVEQGQLLATLIDADFQLALRSAQQSLRMREAELSAHHESIQAAGLDITAAKAEREAAEALVDEMRDRFERYERLSPGAIAEAEIVAAKSAFLRAEATAGAASAAVGQAESEVKRLEARVPVFESAVEAAKVELEMADLALARTRILAPSAGRVLRLIAAPGQKKRLAMDDADSATVAVLFDPHHLQVRVDVPLADAAGLQIGQQVRIRCSLAPDTILHGEVTRITGEADVQRNTLQAKVSIDDPSDQLRPEMLCRVEFLEAIRRGEATTTTGSLSAWVPEGALVGDSVWVCDPESRRVRSRTVRSGKETRDGYVRIQEGIRPGEWVVLAPHQLNPEQRVQPTLIQP
ncbi:multidrug efflux pump subunit AcrA (membrane-fusion protein) [Haloferula luteola]|uniref:Multidrug efflux pump subunit AcrA (Membrane-fusion protein) n=1 Tax=Haloferula luteola TaxID=595692 RepID=A0A840UYS0_9BACT|nr:efflux RND transporter periplasmic adaptor subunit [Haloferula luteola]MBB5349976.1 multidrug efflux pump subunit AcrA (membrane-fusion protein) [Haloferula luteola]